MNGRLAMNGDVTANAAGAEIRDFAEANGFVVANAVPHARGERSFVSTRGSSTNDYVLISAEHDAAIAAFEICSDSGIGSDHKPIACELALTCTAAGPPALPATRTAGVPARARPNRTRIRPDNHELRDTMDAELTAWLADAHADKCASAADVDRLVRSLANTFAKCAATTATEPAHTHGTGPRSGTERTPTRNRPFGAPAATRIHRVAVAIANAAARLKALLNTATPTAGAVSAQRIQLRWLHRKRQAIARREIQRQNRVDERDLFRTGDEPAAWEKLQNALALSRRRRSRATTKAVGALATPDGGLETDPKRIADLFRRHFARESAADGRSASDADKALLQHTAASATARTNLRAPTNDGEIRQHLRKLKNGKAAGPDDTYPELLKMDTPALTRALTATTNAILRTGHWPAAWGVGHIVPLPKAGGNRQCAADYRGISLLSVASKLVESVLNARLMAWLETTNGLHDAQHGFRPGRSTLDAAFVLHELVAATRETATTSRRPKAHRVAAAPPSAPHHTIFVAYLDVRKAYDGCWREGILAQLRARGVDAHTCTLLASMLQPGKVRRTVTIGPVRSAEFAADAGVPQGGVLSPALYNVFIDGLAQAIDADPRRFGAVAHGIRVPALLYADDIALTAHSAAQLQQMLDVCAQYAKQWHFSFNAKKCAAQIVGRDATAERAKRTAQPFTIADAQGARHTVVCVPHFKYLGLRPDFDAQPAHAARWAMQMAAHTASAYGAHHHITAAARRLPWLAPATLMRLHDTYCAPKAEYGAQLWAPFLCTRQRAALDRLQAALQMRALLPTATAASAVPHCFAAGDFARAPPAVHCDELALRYLHHLSRAPPDSTMRRLFDARMRAARERVAQPANTADADRGAQSWCWAMRAVCARHGLTDAWTGAVPMPADAAEWRAACRAATRAHWVQRWRRQTAAHARLNGLYHATRAPRPKPYLRVSASSREGRELYALARSDALPLGVLRADLLRLARDAAVERRRASDLRRTTNARAAADRSSGSDRWQSAADVTDADIAEAGHCDECARRGECHSDTREHFIAQCDSRRYAAFVRVVAAALHRAGHVVRPSAVTHCARARTHHTGHHEVSDRCVGDVMEQRFRTAGTREQIAMCLDGSAQALLRGTAARKSRVAHVAVARALVRCTQNLLLTRWHSRCRVVGTAPTIAFAHSDFGRQVAALQPNGSYALLQAVAPPTQ
jgi:hypothetical protein